MMHLFVAMISEVNEFRDDFIKIVSKGQAKVFVFACLDHLLKEGVDGHLLSPELFAQENPWTCKAERFVVVLHGVLKDFLHCAGTAGGIDDATKGYSQDEIFSLAVFKEFCDMGGEGSGGFMAVEPSGDAQTHIAFFLWEAFHHFEGRSQPAFIFEGWGCLHHIYCLVCFLICSSCHPVSQVGGLHCPGAAAAEHEEAFFGELFAEQRNSSIHGIGSEQCVAAHYADA